MTPASSGKAAQFPCKSCGGKLEFSPGTTALKCPWCGTENAIVQDGQGPVEQDFLAVLTTLSDQQESCDRIEIHCETCGAKTVFSANVTADRCAFCGAPVVARQSSRKLIKPNGLLPFKTTREESIKQFQGWVKGLWFAPGDLRKMASAARVDGIYIPSWTYDCLTQTDYTGQRGDDYWETEPYTTTVNGRTVQQTRQVRRTRWSFVSGTVANTFDDVLVVAGTSLPVTLAQSLEPWDTKDAVAYSDEYVSGFVCESYQLDLKAGFEQARQIMDVTIRRTICRDIGGDHQQISTVSTGYDKIGFKHLLLPVWMSAYRYHDKTYRFLVNARTGEVQGQRPWSIVKITLAVLAVLACVAAVIVAFAS